jgi:hypothetical protein
MNTTAHSVAPEEVMAFLDGELAAGDAQAVSRHMDGCTECGVLVGQFRSTSRSLSTWKVPTVPAKVGDSVAEGTSKFRSGLKIGKANISIRVSFWTWKQWAAGLGAVAAAFVLFLAIATVNRMRSPMQEKAIRLAGHHPVPQPMDQAISTATGFGDGRVNGDGQPVSDQQSKVFSKQIPTQKTPGVRADSNGFFPGLGDHVENAFPVDRPLAPMIARSVSLSIVVKDFSRSRATLDAILARHHSYAAELSASTAENAPRSLHASLRVAAAELTSVLSELKSLGRVENETQSGEEVTQQHADLVARLKNSRETEQRLQAILLERTGKISDVLAVEQEIARVRGEIEHMEAEQKTLEHRVEFAAVNLQLTEEYKAQLGAPAASISTRFHNAFVAGYRDASETVLGIALFLVEYTPTLVIWLVILGLPAVLVWRRYRRTLATI